MSNSLLQDQVVLIIGAGRPPALDLALALAEQGAVIAANDLSPTPLDSLAEAVRARGERIHTYVSDATRGMPLRAMLDEILEDLGRVDILINNPRVHPQAPLLEMDEWDWQRTIEMNLNGPFLVTQLVAKLMREQGRGVILNIVDTNPAVYQTPGHIAYAASQQGLYRLSQAAARELIAYNIRVYTLCPDHVVLQNGGSEKAEPGETLGRLAVVLCSQESAYPPAQAIRVTSSGTAIHLDMTG